MSDWLRDQLGRRPWWMNALLVFCAYMTFVYVPWDLFMKPVPIDEEVWLGIRFHGWAAKLLALPHWAVYGAGLYGFWTLARWMHPWAAVYAAQMALSMLVWPMLYREGPGRFVFALVAGGLFSLVPWALWRARGVFQPASPALSGGSSAR